MKILLLNFFTAAVAAQQMEIARFGGCLNETQVALEAAGTSDGVSPFSCHMESAHCGEGERWLTPMDVESEGFGPCGCDEDYDTNAYIGTCYDLSGSHQVVCAYDGSQCPENWMDLGQRFNNDHEIDESCNDESNASDNEESSCGKRCLCNYHYTSRDGPVDAGTSTYGICYNSESRTYECAVANHSCAEGEEFFGPHEGIDQYGAICNCDDTAVGACMEGGSTFSHCAVFEDSCGAGQSFTTARQLSSMSDMPSCRLCSNTWEGETPAPMAAPVSSPVSAPVNNPVSMPVSSPTNSVTAEDGGSGAFVQGSTVLMSALLYTVLSFAL
ncbi:iron starvation induced protein [Phaeodactylum tricornutum CCAP 1055/1]|jgi:hypothetical protein|uniref:Iron starvation induced protein n=3 Tax=Phaeodactylum tricornutum TaxID=2850 RepID=B7G9B1_PHATC|nr:iron starvation induced protein [Phaeodactylum tricornutum CCAP 1055/1]EEC44924.1 iron starvation induced protein [Phaeodactylum tricornutum CCAP 1055/1]|eukprot:XP_002183742.1 iron starvation induced protein [Phaeodactylum tricornutum CCAP 1055/1]